MLWDIDKQQEDSYLAACKLFASDDDAIIDNLERVKKMEVLEDFIYENYLVSL
jgi:hypothetical protein